MCVNTTTQPQSITPGSCLGHAATVTLVTNEQTNPEPRTETPVTPMDAEKSIDEIIEPVLESLLTDVTDSQRQRVINLLRSHDDLFSRSTVSYTHLTLPTIYSV